MVAGFLLALAAGFVWSLVNVIDKTVVSKYISQPIFIILILSLVSIIAGIFVIPFLKGGMIGWDWSWLLFGSAAYALGNLFYFYALKKEEASRVVPLFSLTTVFVVIFSAIFLGELFGFKTYLGIIIIIIGSLVITSRSNVLDAFRSRAMWLMVLASLGFAIAYTINKELLFTYSYWQVFGWQRILVGVFGFFFFLFFWHEIVMTYQQVKLRYMGLSFFSETVNIVAAFIFLIATSLWYVSLVETVVSIQYVFLFFWTMIISRFKPALFTEEFNKRVILQKVASIALIIVGIYLIV